MTVTFQSNIPACDTQAPQTATWALPIDSNNNADTIKFTKQDPRIIIDNITPHISLQKITLEEGGKVSINAPVHVREVHAPKGGCIEVGKNIQVTMKGSIGSDQPEATIILSSGSSMTFTDTVVLSNLKANDVSSTGETTVPPDAM